MLRPAQIGNQEDAVSSSKQSRFGLKASGKKSGFKSQANIQTEQHPYAPSAVSENANGGGKIVPFSLGSPFDQTKEPTEESPNRESKLRLIEVPDI